MRSRQSKPKAIAANNGKHVFMKLSVLFFMLLSYISTNAQEHVLEKIWETDSIVAVPESVLPDKNRNILFVSLIDGGGWNADGKGGIAMLSFNGEKYDSLWITGLNAPKGLGIINDRLYVADISEVVVIDITKKRIEKRITIESAKGLNDITISDKGILYVSDSRTAKIWRIENDRASLYLDSIKGVNGLKAVGDDLYIGAGKSFLKAGPDKHVIRIAELQQGIDGIEPVGNGDFLLTSWSGYIWYLYADGAVETLLETTQQKKNTADLGYDQQSRLLYIPTFNSKTVMCYRLK